MDNSAYLDQITSGGHGILAAASGHLDRPVPACDGWGLSDLLNHLGSTYRWATEIVEGAGERPAGRDEADLEGDALLAWFGEVHSALVESLHEREPDEPAWVFVSSAPQTVGWWRRRLAHETTVHLYDATAAVGAPAAVDADMAADGVDEYLTVMLGRALKRQPVDALTGSLHLHATDTPGEWWLDLDEPGSPARREHAKADTALRGPAGGLELWLWNRQTPAEAGLEVFGSATVVEAFRDIRI